MRGFILGLLVSSLFSTICLIIYDLHEDSNWGIVSGGIFMWIVFFISKCYEKINHLKRFYNRKSLLSCPDGKFRYIDYKIVDNYINFHNGYYFVKYDAYKNAMENKYPCALWGEFVSFNKAPNMRYTPKCVWKDFEPIE